MPCWRADGSELLYENVGAKKLMAVDIKTAGGKFEAGIPKRLFDLPEGFSDIWDTSPDRQKFLSMVPNSDAPQAFTVAVNWLAGLKK